MILPLNASHVAPIVRIAGARSSERRGRNAGMIGRFIDRITESFSLLGGLALVLAMVHVNLDVALRYLIGAPLSGTIEIVSYYYMIALVFLPLAAVERRNGHISVELVSQKLSPRHQRILIGLVSLVSAVYFGLLAWRLWLDAVEKAQVGETYTGSLSLPIWPPRFFMPLSCGLLTVLLIYKSVRLLSGDPSPLEKPASHDGIGSGEEGWS
jgi:TRAP-type C4-dicarboxylate transport system permease small subunit